jgi:tRNA threonylcarbamoyladenosine biosynthesis protein TsaB
MPVLAIETATTQVGCAIGDREGALASFHASYGRRHAESLAPAVRFCLRQAGTSLEDLSGLVVDVGPGLFTGLRVGVATAKAMAFALALPVTGVSSLDVLAHQVGYSSRAVAAVIDARRGEVFWSTYDRGSAVSRRRSPYRASRPEQLRRELARELAGAASGAAPPTGSRTEEGFLLVGDGAVRYEALLAPAGTVVHGAASVPSAVSLLELAGLGAGERVDAARLAPMYLRQADARINWESRRAPRPGRLGEEAS